MSNVTTRTPAQSWRPSMPRGNDCGEVKVEVVMSVEFPDITTKTGQSPRQALGGRSRRAVVAGLVVSAFVVAAGATYGATASHPHSKTASPMMRPVAADENCPPASANESTVSISVNGKSIPVRPGVTRMVVRDDTSTTVINTHQCQHSSNAGSSVSVDMHEMMQQEGGDE